MFYMINYLICIISVELVIIILGIKYIINNIKKELRDNDNRILQLEKRIEKLRKENKK